MIIKKKYNLLNLLPDDHDFIVTVKNNKNHSIVKINFCHLSSKAHHHVLLIFFTVGNSITWKWHITCWESPIITNSPERILCGRWEYSWWSLVPDCIWFNWRPGDTKLIERHKYQWCSWKFLSWTFGDDINRTGRKEKKINDEKLEMFKHFIFNFIFDLTTFHFLS